MSCPIIEELYWDDLLEGGWGPSMAQDRVPFAGTLEVTERCNLRCVHCYLTHEPPEPELSLDEIRRIFDEAAELGCFGMLITGGEPLVRRDLLEIYAEAKKHGFWVALFTNGTLLTPEIADYLEEWRPRLVEISIYGATAETYERITGVPGSYARCLRGIELIRERDIPLVLKTMALRQNVHELEAMKDLAASLAVDFRFDQMVHARNDGCLAPLEARLSASEAVRLDWEDRERRQEWTELFSQAREPGHQDRSLFRCGAGVGMFVVDAYGWLSPCLLVRSLGFSLRAMSFQEGWRDVLPAQMAGELPAGHPCVDCAWFYLCLQCPGWSELELGNLTDRVDYLCQVTHQRAEVFGNGRTVDQCALSHIRKGAKT